MYATYRTLSKKEEVDTDLLKNVVKITGMDQKKGLIENNRVCVIDIYADWCGPCKQIAPAYAQMAKKYNQVKACVLCKENIDDGFTDRQSVTGVPTFVFFKSGKYVTNIVGCDLEQVEQTILGLIKPE